MAHLLRVASFAFALLLPGLASAANYVATGSMTYNGAFTSYSGSGGTAAAAAESWRVTTSAVPAWVCSADGSTGGTRTVTVSGVTESAFNYTVVRNATPAFGACSDTAASTYNGVGSITIPVDVCASMAGKSAGTVQWFAGPVGAYPTKPSYSYCDSYQSVGNGLCTATATKDICAGVDGQWVCTGAASYSGVKASSCTGDGSAPGTPSPITKPSDGSAAPVTPKAGEAAPAPCAAGMQAGTVNGVRVCAPYGVDAPTVSASPETGIKTVVNADGTSTTTTTKGVTTCAGNVCTTNNNVSTTNNNAAGAPTSTASSATNTSQSASAFCQSNGKSAQCSGQGDGKGGSFSGSCAAGFKADGDDAVLNAMAQEQFRLNCKVLAADAAESVAISALLDSAGVTQAVNPNDKTVNISSSSFDTSSALGGGSCNLNKTIVVARMSATLPLNVLCDPLAVLGQLLVAVSLLLSVRIVGRG